MKLAILSDIHGNLPALHAVAEHIARWRPDAVYVNGDVVNRGPLPAECWQFVRAQGWPIVRGNHEEFVANWLAPEIGPDSPYYNIYANSRWSYERMGTAAQELADLPDQLSLTDPAGKELRLAHGSMAGNTKGIYPATTDDELLERIAPAPAVFLAAHTHIPLIRTLNGTLVVNTGAVGAPFDGDVRASYGQLTWSDGRWQAHIVRIPYDRETARRDFFDSGFFDETRPLSRIMLREWETAGGLINFWGKRYEQRVVQGEISLQESVDEFLRETSPP